MSALDRDLQNLVYENYSKFLSAEQTLHSLSDGLTSLSEKTGGVMRSLATVSEVSANMDRYSGERVHEVAPGTAPKNADA